MAYDEGLEARIDDITRRWSMPELTKKKMFGGIGYLLSGNMAFGIWKDHPESGDVEGYVDRLRKARS